MVDRFYRKKEWLKVRESVLRRAEYKDELELRSGRNVPAELVHHIFPYDKYPEYGLEKWNLIAISNHTHELLHNRATNDLSPLGWDLLFEVAEKKNIPISRTILVVGLPGTGKEEFVRQHIRNGLVYNLDHIAAAFRLTEPHKERYEPARKMANDMLRSFANNAARYSGLVWIIRTAPTMEEFTDIRPDAVVLMTKKKLGEKREKLPPAKQRVYEDRLTWLARYCQESGIDFQAW